MIREINIVRLHNKEYKLGDITVEDYILFMKDPNKAFIKMRKEFNDNMPKYLEQQDVDAIINGLFSFLDKKAKGSKKKSKDASLTLPIAYIMNVYHQQRSEILAMPLYFFFELYEKINVVMGAEQEGGDEPDKEEIKNAFKNVSNVTIDSKL